MKIVTKIANFIRASHLQHRLFKALLEDSEKHDLILHNVVRWLSKRKTLSRFDDLIEEIKNYLNSKNQFFVELMVSFWLVNLGFITYFMKNINHFILELQ